MRVVSDEKEGDDGDENGDVDYEDDWEDEAAV